MDASTRGNEWDAVLCLGMAQGSCFVVELLSQKLSLVPAVSSLLRSFCQGASHPEQEEMEEENYKCEEKHLKTLLQ